MSGPASTLADTGASRTAEVPTDAQLRVILASDGHLLVGAGAGSGKTSTMVQKVCYLLGAPIRDAHGAEHRVSSPLTLGEIAAITFTNQAAADLRRKLRAALLAHGLRALAADVDSARIGTIHGFCGDILRDFALRAGLPPSRQVLDEGEASVVAADAARAVLHRAAERGDDGLVELLQGRRIGDVLDCLVELASDASRLASWEQNAGMLRPHERTLLSLACETTRVREAELARQGALDFDRMIVATRDLLRDDADVRHAVQRGMRLLVVDEFQDVDPAQRDIALSLGGITTHDPQPTRVVLVGDPKQSIYRFRRADVTLWNDVAARFTRDGIGSVLQLSDNFRSKRGILALVDDLVGARLARAVHDDGVRRPFEVDYLPLDARWKHADGDECVELLVVPPGDDGKARIADEVRKLEAQAVADRIAAMHADGTGYGEIALLLTGWGALDLYERALRARGIPTYALRTEGFWDAREVLDCLLALRAIRDARDEVALMGFLKGPCIGVRDDTLVALADARAPGGPVEAMRTEPRERALLDRAQRMLARFGALRDRVPTHELLSLLVRESGLLVALALDAERGQQAIANVRKLVRIATSCSDDSLGEFLRNVAEIRQRGDREGQERLYRERADVVTITSVHSAKGLEWPVVFWCDLVREPRVENGALLCGRDRFRLRANEPDADDKDDASDAEHAALLQELRTEATAESYRLWYVASTRPQRLLVLSGIPLGEAKDAASVAGLVRVRFGEALLGAEVPDAIAYSHSGGEQFRLVVRTTSDTHLPAPSRRAEAAHVDIALPPDRIPALSGRVRLSATQLMTFRRDPERWWAQYVFGFDAAAAAAPGVAAGGGSDRTGPAGARETGVVVHDVLERFGFELADIDELIEGAIERHAPDTPDGTTHGGRAFRSAVREMVGRAASHPAWCAVSDQPSARRELPFTRVLEDGSTIEGKFDLAAIADGSVRILDAKTGTAAHGATLAERYAVQAAAYTEGARAIMGGAPATFALLSTSTGDVTEAGGDTDILLLVKELRAWSPPAAPPH